MARKDGCFVTSSKSVKPKLRMEEGNDVGKILRERNRGCRRDFKLAVKFHRNSRLVYNIKADKIFAAVEYNSGIADWSESKFLLQALRATCTLGKG